MTHHADMTERNSDDITDEQIDDAQTVLRQIRATLIEEIPEDKPADEDLLDRLDAVEHALDAVHEYELNTDWRQEKPADRIDPDSHSELSEFS